MNNKINESTLSNEAFNKLTKILSSKEKVITPAMRELYSMPQLGHGKNL